MLGNFQATFNGGLERAISYSRGDNGILALLRQDHAQIVTRMHVLLRHYQRPDLRAEIFDALRAQLNAHCTAEYEVLYTWRRQTPRGLAPTSQAEREHQAIDRLLVELSQRPLVDPAWRDGFQSLQRLVTLHFQDEEHQLFETVRRVIGREERNAMASRYVRKREALLERVS